MDRISVVITCYNEGELLRRAFASLESQTDKDFETLIVNDASSDVSTNQICRELEQEKKAHIIWHKENCGLSAARNSGYEAIEGDICVPLDADDTLPQAAIAAIRNGFRKAPEADFIFGNYIRREPEKGIEKLIDCSVLCSRDGFLNPRYLATHNWILYGGSPCRKSLWRRIGGYLQEFSYDGQDVDFWMRALMSGAKGCYINHTIYEWNRSKTGMNYNVPKERWLQVYINNILFFDRFGNGIKARMKFIYQHISIGKFKKAQELAQQMIRLLVSP